MTSRRFGRLDRALLGLLVSGLLAACGSAPAKPPAQPPALAKAGGVSFWVPGAE